MKLWVDHFHDQMDAFQSRKDAELSRKEEQAEIRRTPMKERIQRVLKDLPPDQRDGPFSIELIVSQLAPRWAGKRASPRDVAEGLRQLGFVRTRAWRDADQGFRALWHREHDAGDGGRRRSGRVGSTHRVG